MPASSGPVLTWKMTLLAVAPGLLAMLGWVKTDFSEQMLLAAALLGLYLGGAYLVSGRCLPPWSLMAAGMLTAMGVTILSGVIGGVLALLTGAPGNAFVWAIFLAGGLALLRLWGPVPRLAWLFLAGVIACQMLVRIKYFVFFGLSWPVAGQWLNISLYAATLALLLPVAIGLYPARRYGPAALLFVIGMIYTSFQLLIDVNQKVSGQIGAGLGLALYRAFIPLLFTVVAPAWFVRASTARSRTLGLLAWVGASVLLDLIIVGLSYNGELPEIIWISFIPYTLSVLLTLLAALRLYSGVFSSEHADGSG